MLHGLWDSSSRLGVEPRPWQRVHGDQPHDSENSHSHFLEAITSKNTGAAGSYFTFEKNWYLCKSGSDKAPEETWVS